MIFDLDEERRFGHRDQRIQHRGPWSWLATLPRKTPDSGSSRSDSAAPTRTGTDWGAVVTVRAGSMSYRKAYDGQSGYPLAWSLAVVLWARRGRHGGPDRRGLAIRIRADSPWSDRREHHRGDRRIEPGVTRPGEKRWRRIGQRYFRSETKHEAQASVSEVSDTLACASCLYFRISHLKWRCPT